MASKAIAVSYLSVWFGRFFWLQEVKEDGDAEICRKVSLSVCGSGLDLAVAQ